MYKLFIFFITLFASPAFSQPHIAISYDAAGNRILRRYVLAVTESEDRSVADSMLVRSTKVWPNPTNGTLQVSFSSNNEPMEVTEPLPWHIELYALGGQLLLQEKAMDQATLNLTAYPAGVYLLRVSKGARNAQWKVEKVE